MAVGGLSTKDQVRLRYKTQIENLRKQIKNMVKRRPSLSPLAKQQQDIRIFTLRNRVRQLQTLRDNQLSRLASTNKPRGR